MSLIQIQTNDTHVTIDPHTSVTTTPIMVLTAEHPELLPILDRFGLDTCCGGHLTVVEACGEHGLAVGALTEALLEALVPHGGERPL
jgi:iron-sulfur cluster repair protein YtfE (RIC family)